MVKPRRSPIFRRGTEQVISFAHYQYLEFMDLKLPTQRGKTPNGYRNNQDIVNKYSWLNWGPLIKKLTYEFKAKNQDNPNTF
jgi:hypothetical protein